LVIFDKLIAIFPYLVFLDTKGLVSNTFSHHILDRLAEAPQRRLGFIPTP